MNYTQNYHLPQWEKSDRIMMDDFNQMCTNIESGLQNNQENMDAMRSQFLDLLSPMACDLYRAVAHDSDQSKFDVSWRGLRFNSFATEEPAIFRSGLNWHPEGYLSLGTDDAWTKEQIAVTYEGDGFGHYSPAEKLDNAGVCTFISPGCGVLQSVRVGIHADMSGSILREVKMMYQLTVKRKMHGTFAPVVRCSPISITHAQTETLNLELPLDVSLLGGSEYQIEFSRVSDSVGGAKFTFGPLEYPSKKFVCTVDTQCSTTGTLTRRYLTFPENYQRVIALVRYTGGEISVSIDGQKMELTRTSTVRLSIEEFCQEAEFMLPPRPSRDVKAELTATCPDGNMKIYDWGFIFI